MNAEPTPAPTGGPSDAELGGEAPCWAHLLDERPDLDSVARVEVLVREFYRRVAVDDLLGPVFAGVEVDWAAHLPKMVEFWSWQLLGERGYVGQPLLAHRAVADRHPFGAAHFERWLDLFDETVDEHFAGPIAQVAHGRARKMAAALQRLLRDDEDRDDPGDAPVSVTLATGTVPS